MKSGTSTTRWLGAAFVAQFVTSLAAGILSIKLLAAGPAGALAATTGNIAVIRGTAMLEVFTAVGVLALATLLHAIVGDDNRPLALVASGLWIAEAILYVVGALGLYGLVELASGASAAAGGASLAGAGALAFSIHQSAYTAAMLFFCIGALLWYSLLYRTEVVPRWLAGWGFLSTLPLLVSITLTLWDRSLGLGVIAGIPYIPFEFTIGIWLFVFAGRSVASHHGIAIRSSRRAAPARLGGALS